MQDLSHPAPRARGYRTYRFHQGPRHTPRVWTRLVVLLHRVGVREGEVATDGLGQSTGMGPGGQDTTASASLRTPGQTAEGTQLAEESLQLKGKEAIKAFFVGSTALTGIEPATTKRVRRGSWYGQFTSGSRKWLDLSIMLYRLCRN